MKQVTIGVPAPLYLEPTRDADLGFLSALYASTREQELSAVDWSEADKASFLASQFMLQHRYYQQHYAGARFDIIKLAQRPIGRLYLGDLGEDYRIIDIALVPEARGRGIGTGLLRAVLAAAELRGARVSIHVERTNPALRLYERLGFSLCEDKGVYLFLVHPQGQRSVA